MKFLNNQKELNYYLQSAAKFIPAKSTNPALDGVYLDAREGKVSLEASNQEVGVKCFFSSELKKEGSAVLPAKFADIIRLLPEKTVDIEIDDSYNVTIKYPQGKYKLRGLDPQDYPRSAPGEALDTGDFTVDSHLLADMIRSVSFSVSQDEGKPVFTGVCFSLQGDTLTLISSDSFRVSIKKGTVNNITGKEIKVIVPVKVLQEINKFKFNEESVKITVEQGRISFKVDNFCFYSKILQDEYPQVEKIIPTSYSTSFRAEREKLLESLQRVSLISAGERNLVNICIKDQSVSFTASSEAGNSLEEVSLEGGVEGEGLDIYYNSRFLLEPLKMMYSTGVELSFKGENGPCVINTPGEQERELYYILPVKMD